MFPNKKQTITLEGLKELSKTALKSFVSVPTDAEENIDWKESPCYMCEKIVTCYSACNDYKTWRSAINKKKEEPVAALTNHF